MDGKVYLGIDGGGTYTRAAVADFEGNILSNIKHDGGASKYKNANAEENVKKAVFAALDAADSRLEDIAGLASGIAGYDNRSDLRWVRRLTKLKGLRCPIQYVNDAVIAHRGALLFKPGIIAVSGTGSIVFGITENGKQLRNYDFKHYANSAARFLSYNSVNKILAGKADSTDSQLVEAALKYFNADSISMLRKLDSKSFFVSEQEMDKLFGDFAPIVTASALSGSHIATTVCLQAAQELAEGIRLVGTRFKSKAAIQTALVGSVANSAYIKNAVGEFLCNEKNQSYELVDSALPPVLGAVLMAMRLPKRKNRALA